MAIGVEAAGWAHIALLEWDRLACETLSLNRPWWKVMQTDVDLVDWRRFTHRVDLLCGGPPCQPYSDAGAKKGSEDERDGWPATLTAVHELRPAWCMFENVLGMLGTRELHQVIDTLGGFYPWVALWRLQAADFGLPQERERLFVVAGPRPAIRPSPTHARPGTSAWWDPLPPWRSIREALGFPPHATGIRRGHGFLPDRVADLDRPSQTLTTASFGCGTDLRVNLAPGLTQREIDTLAQVPTDLYGRTFDRPPDGWKWEHRHGDDGMRRLTEVELQVISGFPPGWSFAGPPSARTKQRGNAVPPALSRAVAAALRTAAG